MLIWESEKRKVHWKVQPKGETEANYLKRIIEVLFCSPHELCVVYGARSWPLFDIFLFSWLDRSFVWVCNPHAQCIGIRSLWTSQVYIDRILFIISNAETFFSPHPYSIFCIPIPIIFIDCIVFEKDDRELVLLVWVDSMYHLKRAYCHRIVDRARLSPSRFTRIHMLSFMLNSHS